jgi:hypothetical protein
MSQQAHLIQLDAISPSQAELHLFVYLLNSVWILLSPSISIYTFLVHLGRSRFLFLFISNTPFGCVKAQRGTISFCLSPCLLSAYLWQMTSAMGVQEYSYSSPSPFLADYKGRSRPPLRQYPLTPSELSQKVFILKITLLRFISIRNYQ